MMPNLNLSRCHKQILIRKNIFQELIVAELLQQLDNDLKILCKIILEIKVIKKLYNRYQILQNNSHRQNQEEQKKKVLECI